MSDHTFQQVASEYFEQPGSQDFSAPTGKDGEPLTPKGRELVQILREQEESKAFFMESARRKLQDNFTWILDHQNEENQDAEYAYHTLLEIIQNCADYHNETGKKAERLIEILRDPTILDE